MHNNGQRKGPGTSRSLEVMVILHMVLFGIMKIVGGNFMSLQLVSFLVHLMMLVLD